MSVWSALKRGLGATDEPTRAEHPTFEHLEPRLLLSADPIGLASQNSLDFLDDQTYTEAAIVVDLDEALQFPDHGSQITDVDEGILVGESHEAELSQDELQAASPLVSSQSESQPAPSDVQGITDDRLQTADDPLLITDY